MKPLRTPSGKTVISSEAVRILLTKLRDRLRRLRLFKTYTVAIAFDETNGIFTVTYYCNQ